VGSRTHQRLKAVLPVRVSGKAADGTVFDELTYTLDISRTGVRLVLPRVVPLDEVLTIFYRQRKATFKVMWVGAQNGGRDNVGGLAAIDPSIVLWSELKKEEKGNYRDDFVREERDRQEAVRHPAPAPAKAAAAAAGSHPGSSSSSAATSSSAPAGPASPKRTATTSSQVMELTASLLALQTELGNNSVDAALLKEFRDALAKTREAAWMAQQRLELEKSKGGGTGLPLVSIINNERLNTAARVCTEFMEDFSKADLSLDEKAVNAFLAIAEQLVFELALAVS
jgi:hypothetical protein